MQPFRQVKGRAYPFGRKNVDTDLIIPARHMKTMTRAGLGRWAFETIRIEIDNVFDDPIFAQAPILIAGANFGCGSSREHAAWALADMGVRVVIAPSFSDIFASNAFKNGMLTVALPGETVGRLLEYALTGALTVDLEACTIVNATGETIPFAADPFRRHCLLEGIDEISLALAEHRLIDNFEICAAAEKPWISLAGVSHTPA